MAITIDSELTISPGGNPIQGSVSLSQDDSDIVIARYEGGAIAGVKGSVKYKLTASFYGKGSTGVSSEQTVTMTNKSGTSLTLNNCVVITTVGWNSDTGFVTDMTATGYA